MKRVSVICAVAVVAYVRAIPVAVAQPEPAKVGSGSISVCSTEAKDNPNVPNAGQYQTDCKMVMATCMLFAGVGAYGADQSGTNAKVNACIHKGIAQDQREYDAWLKKTRGGRDLPPPDPAVVEAKKEQMAEIQRQQEERLEEERALCTQGRTVRVKVRTSMWRSHGIGMFDRLAGHANPGDLAEAQGVDSTGSECTIAMQNGGEVVTGTVPLYGFEVVNQPVVRQTQSTMRQCRRVGWVQTCSNVRN
jgi:hypothetical protein